MVYVRIRMVVQKCWNMIIIWGIREITLLNAIQYKLSDHQKTEKLLYFWLKILGILGIKIVQTKDW
jgi:hypothetical protein